MVFPKRIGVLSLFFITIFLNLHSQSIDSSIVNLVQKNVFEVVLKKPSTGSLEYERGLPFDRLDFKLRNDLYYSVGTAFAIEGGRFLSAAHVFSPTKETQVFEYYIRTRNNDVFPIGQVYQFSDSLDFIVFDVEGFSPTTFLEMNGSYALNDFVFAVGNALGDGIVIRDGLLTSITPESENGRWNWLRFSAPASQGNSGGPLLDSTGKVIGLILMKSYNENLNYALPISEILSFEPNIGISQKKVNYSISIFNNYLKPAFFETRIVLPLNYQYFHFQLKNEFSRWIDTLVIDVQKEWKDSVFPYGKGSEDILFSSGVFPFPGIIAQRQDSGWGVFSPQNLKKSQLENSGEISYGKIADFTMVKVKIPENIELSEFYSDSKKFMDVVLAGLPYYREMAGESVRITSLGEAKKYDLHEDSWGRVWISGQWVMDYSDMLVCVYALPVPDGVVLIIRADSTDAILNGYAHDFKYLSDFVVASYTGDLVNWSNFLKLKEYLPLCLKSMGFDSYENTFRFDDSFISFVSSNSLLSWNQESLLTVGVSFEKKNNQFFLVPRSYILNDNKPFSTVVEIKKILQPQSFSTISESFRTYFNQISNLVYPYDGRVIQESGVTQQYVIAQNKLFKDYFSLSCSTYLPDSDSFTTEVLKDLSITLFPSDYFDILTENITREITPPVLADELYEIELQSEVEVAPETEIEVEPELEVEAEVEPEIEVETESQSEIQIEPQEEVQITSLPPVQLDERNDVKVEEEPFQPKIEYYEDDEEDSYIFELLEEYDLSDSQKTENRLRLWE